MGSCRRVYGYFRFDSRQVRPLNALNYSHNQENKKNNTQSAIIDTRGDELIGGSGVKEIFLFSLHGTGKHQIGNTL